MHPSISYSYVEKKKEYVRHGRNHIEYSDLGDMQFNIPFAEFASRSDFDVSDMFAYARVHCDVERLAEELTKAGYSLSGDYGYRRTDAQGGCLNFFNDYIPYGAQEALDEQEGKKAANEEVVLAQQGEDAHKLYNSLPEGTGAIFSPRMNELFGELFDMGDEVDEDINNLLYALCLRKVKRGYKNGVKNY
ncbi:hypothetical protein [Xenorhabdus hominickii]|uniref:Uncharacterized protein n=1 Tax=Xenorhabdus hominickii TaxID=351679 RepID=A0A2G0Q2Q8_XENHO|nr:hypothetical protein [Xenorhabdus hominickii]AOM39729.1 hypothetical protein A9255_03475 [Xenorhabdus hominickii]PHM53495.1 hypothetical protein Xhom_03493 [Xenorhabdus hominickii]